MNRKEHDVLSAILDGEADDREVQKFLAQAHDPELEARWRAICQQRDFSHEDSAAWAKQDLRGGLWEALDVESTDPVSEEIGQRALKDDEISQDTEASAGLPWWASLAVAASVMGLVVLGVAPPYKGNTDQPSLVESSGQEAPAWVASPLIENQTLSESEKQAYEARVQSLLLQHTGNASLALSPGPETLARLTSYSQSPDTVQASGEEAEALETVPKKADSQNRETVQE